MGKAQPNAPEESRIPEAGLRFLDDFDSRSVIGLTPRGDWTKNPKSAEGRISNEWFFRLYLTPPESRADALARLTSLVRDRVTWTTAKKLFVSLAAGENGGKPPGDETSLNRWITVTLLSAGRAEPDHGFLVLHGVVVWLLLHEALRRGAEAPVRGWDRDGQRRKREAADAFSRFKRSSGLLSDREEASLAEVLAEIRSDPPPSLRGIPEQIAQELDLELALSGLLEQARRPGSSEECYSLIIEKLRPSMGIVDEISPALLRPCLYLLDGEALDVDSGIPYNAAVILSVLQDPRSTSGLLDALRRIPVPFSKIRENLIYTLGCLGESQAVPLIVPSLEAPDEAVLVGKDGKQRSQLLREQKEEALRALGKIGAAALPALPALLPYTGHEHALLRTYLAWALGSVGRAQKERFDGVSADIVISLLELLKSKNRMVFEETVAAMRDIRMPEFLHTLYLYSVGAVSILGLKPAQRGLYDLSETLHYLIRTKGRAIIAVNGDSGTGKTYFCQAVSEGIAGVRADEILHLMRDRRRDQKTFNRLLGMDWLKKYINPSYYENDPSPEDQADPETTFRRFMREHAAKKLIILDGCRDRFYFQRVIDLFYFHGLLDVEVNFRATLSTRRWNLEEREKALDSVKSHLAFLEEPALEDTWFYKEGRVILYDLDNSIGSRLDRDEIRELFSKQKISFWGDLIRVGDFGPGARRVTIQEEPLEGKAARAHAVKEAIPPVRSQAIEPRERRFRGQLNREGGRPHLLETLPMENIKPGELELYAQDQLAGIGQDGEIFVLTFIDNRIFHHREPSAAHMALHGRDIYISTAGGDLLGLSFERKERLVYSTTGSPIRAVAPCGNRGIVTGHANGELRLWLFEEREMLSLPGRGGEITSVAVDYRGMVYSVNRNAVLQIWDPESEQIRTARIDGPAPEKILFRPPQGIVILSPPGTIRLLNQDTLECRRCEPVGQHSISGLALHPDGRLFFGVNQERTGGGKKGGRVAVFAPEQESPGLHLLEGFSLRIDDLLLMGPRIVTCGADADGRFSIRILGTKYFVRTEAAHRELQPE